MDVDEEAEPVADEQGPSRVAIAIAVVAVVAVLAFGGWLITRGDEDLTAAPAGTEDTTVLDEPAVTDVDSTPPASIAEPTTAAPTTVAVSASIAPVVAPVDPTPLPTPPAPNPSPSLPPASGDTAAPPSVVPPPSQPPSIAPPSIVPPSVVAPPPAVVPSPPDSTAPGGAPPTAPPPPAPSPEPPPTEPPGGGGGSADAADLVPNVAGEAVFVRDGAQRRLLIDGLLAAPRHDVAAANPVSMICAAVVVDERVRLGGRWEVDSRPLASTDPVSVGPPGLGECVDADGDDLPAGAYQFVAVDPTGVTSAAGTFVAGAERVDQQFRNDSSQDVCTILIGPSTASYYEPYRLGSAGIEPGAALTIPLAAVSQDVRTIACDGAELAEFSFDPSSGAVQDLTP